jgi:hypothetical protein
LGFADYLSEVHFAVASSPRVTGVDEFAAVAGNQPDSCPPRLVIEDGSEKPGGLAILAGRSRSN